MMNSNEGFTMLRWKAADPSTVDYDSDEDTEAIGAAFLRVCDDPQHLEFFEKPSRKSTELFRVMKSNICIEIEGGLEVFPFEGVSVWDVVNNRGEDWICVSSKKNIWTPVREDDDAE